MTHPHKKGPRMDTFYHDLAALLPRAPDAQTHAEIEAILARLEPPVQPQNSGGGSGGNPPSPPPKP